MKSLQLPHQKVFGASWNDLWANAQTKSCITDFLCTLLMLIPIRLHSSLLFHKYCNSHSCRVRMYQGGRECDPSSQKLKWKEFLHTSWMWATVMWGQSPYSPQISDPITPPPLLPTPSPRVELILIPRLRSDHGQFKRKKRKKEKEWLSNVFM